MTHNGSLVMTDKFAPHNGGTAVVWSEWCRRWPANETRVVTRQFPGWREYDSHQQYEIARVPFLDIPKLRMPLVWMRIFAEAVRQCAGQRASVIHIGQLLEIGRYAPRIKRRFGIPYVVHTYGEELSAAARSAVGAQRVRALLDGAAAVTTISGHSRRLLRERIGFEGPVIMVHPGVDTSRFCPGDRMYMRNRFGIGDSPMILTVARLMRRKGHDRVLESLPRILRRFPDARYVIAGTGPEESYLRSIARRLKLEKSVMFIGRVAPADLVPLIRAADVFVHPNRELEDGDVEGFGIVFLEASACGIPVIGGDSGGARDAVANGETGYLIDPNDRNSLADHILTLLGDSALSAKMGASGIEWARRFTWDAPAGQVWELSQQIA